MKSRTPHGGGRSARRRAHPRCPFQHYYADRESADTAAMDLGSRARPCTRCGGYHLTI